MFRLLPICMHFLWHLLKLSAYRLDDLLRQFPRICHAVLVALMLFKVMIPSAFPAPLKGRGTPQKTVKWNSLPPLRTQNPKAPEYLKKVCSEIRGVLKVFFHWYKYFKLVVNNPRLKKKNHHYPRVGRVWAVCIKINSSKLGHSFLFVLVLLTRKCFSFKN